MKYQPIVTAGVREACSFNFNWSDFISYSNDMKDTMVSVYSKTDQTYLFVNNVIYDLLHVQPEILISGNMDFWLSRIKKEDLTTLDGHFLEQDCENNVDKTVRFQYQIKSRDDQWKFISHEQFCFEFRNQLFVTNLVSDVSEKESIKFYLLQHHRLEVEIPNFKHVLSEKCISKREQEVLQLIGKGYSSREIAENLCISSHTAISHRKSLIDKFNVKNTAQLIQVASKSMLLG